MNTKRYTAMTIQYIRDITANLLQDTVDNGTIAKNITFRSFSHHAYITPSGRSPPACTFRSANGIQVLVKLTSMFYPFWNRLGISSNMIAIIDYFIKMISLPRI